MDRSACIELAAAEQTQLLDIAVESLQHGFRRGQALRPPLDDLSNTLRAHRAVFVTLTRNNQLRGCIGTLEPAWPLAHAVADSSHGAAFRDPRFPALQENELDDTEIEISVLSPLQELPPVDRQTLLQSLVPHVDGLLIKDSGRQATFLPKVWEKLPEPEEFLGQLLLKAGLDSDHWSGHTRCWLYRTVTFGSAVLS